MGPGDATTDPPSDLPVAANPPMLAPRVGEVPRWVVVVELDVRDQPRPRERALDEIVTEQRVLGKLPIRRALERVDVVDPLPRVRPLAEQILIHIRHGGRV